MFGFDSSEFRKSTASIFVALLVVGFVPLVGLIRIVPLLKEVVLGAAVVAAFTSISDTKRAVKFALLTGMVAAVLFNVVFIPGQILLGGLFGAVGESSTATGGAFLSGLGALANLIGLVLFSPFGYAIGGAIGGFVNG